MSRRGSRSTERHRLRRALGACASCAALIFVSCAPAGISAPGQIRPDLLYVADRGAGTLSLLDGTGAHALGRAVPVGPAPALLAAGSAGRALISSSDPEQQARLSLLEPTKPAGWNVRSVTLGDGSRVRLVAGAGDTAVVLFSSAGGSSLGECQLALVDLRRGAVLARHDVCGPRDLPAGLALERRLGAPGVEGSPVAYVALWRASGDEGGQRVAAGARIVSLRADTGAALGSTPLEGLPRPPVLGGALTMAPGPDGPRLYAVTAYPGTVWGRWSEQEFLLNYWMSGDWRLTRFDPATVQPEASTSLSHAPVWFGISPDGAAAYSLDGRGSVRNGTELYEIDLASGASRPLVSVPVTTGGSLAVTRDRVYVPDPDKGTVWVVDRHLGRVERGLPFGRSPSAIVPLG